MPWTIAVSLFVLWVLGVTFANALGGLVHLLLAAAVIVLLVRILRGPGRGSPRAASG